MARALPNTNGIIGATIRRKFDGALRGFDGHVADSFSSSTDLLQRTLQNGAKVTDHVVANRIPITLEVQICENPTADTGLQGWSTPSGVGRCEEARTFLLTTQRLGYLIDYMDSRGVTYYDVLISSISWDNSANGEMRFKITAEQVQFAEVNYVPTPVISRASAKKPAGPTAADLGTSELTPEDVPAPLISTLRAGTGAAAVRRQGIGSTPGKDAPADYAYAPWRHLQEPQKGAPVGGKPAPANYDYAPWRHLQEAP